MVDDEPSKFFILNHFKFKNKKKFIENNRLWGKMVVKPQLKDRNGFSWGCATILSYGEWDNVVGNHIMVCLGMDLVRYLKLLMVGPTMRTKQ